MLKKLLLVGVAAAVGIVVLNATGLAKHVPAAFRKVKEKIEDRISLEDHIKAIRGDIAKLAPNVEDAKIKLAQGTVEARRLKNQIADLRPKLDELRATVKANLEDLDAKEQKVSAYERAQFASDFAKLKKGETELEVKEKMLSETELRVGLLRDNLEALMAAQKQAESEVENLDRERLALELQQTRSKYQMDDSRLSEIKESIQKVRDRIETQRVKLELDSKYGTETMPAASKASGADAVTEAKAYFGKKDAVNVKK